MKLVLSILIYFCFNANIISQLDSIKPVSGFFTDFSIDLSKLNESNADWYGMNFGLSYHSLIAGFYYSELNGINRNLINNGEKFGLNSDKAGIFIGYNFSLPQQFFAVIDGRYGLINISLKPKSETDIVDSSVTYLGSQYAVGLGLGYQVIRHIRLFFQPRYSFTKGYVGLENIDNNTFSNLSFNIMARFGLFSN